MNKGRAAKLFDLFLCTFKLGAVTFGGGYVIVPLLQQEFVQKRNYIEEKDILDIIAVSQSLPGVISINACIMVGYRAAGVAGALLTSLGVVLPSLITLSIVTYFYQAFVANQYVSAALLGIRAGVAALMLNSVIRLGKPVLKGAFPFIAMAASFLLSYQLGLSAILIIILSGAAGIVFYMVAERKRENG